MAITLATLADHTAQEVFDYVVRHLHGQKVPSKDTGGHCKYRGPEGLMCAAGCLIADEEYTPSMEGNSWRDLVEECALPQAHTELIEDLQRAHDDAGGITTQDRAGYWANCARYLREVATVHGLKDTVPA